MPSDPNRRQTFTLEEFINAGARYFELGAKLGLHKGENYGKQVDASLVKARRSAVLLFFSFENGW